MNPKIRSVGVYCGSSVHVTQEFKQIAHNFGQSLAKHNIQMIYGGGTTGLMGICASSCAEAGGQVIGVTTTYLKGLEGGYEGGFELRIVESMHERKLEMFKLSDAFVILPGGLGTLDESFEIMTWKQIGLHSKDIIFLNYKGYWSPLVDNLLPHMIENKFVREEDKELFKVASDSESVFTLFTQTDVKGTDFVSKWGYEQENKST